VYIVLVLFYVRIENNSLIERLYYHEEIYLIFANLCQKIYYL